MTVGEWFSAVSVASSGPTSAVAVVVVWVLVLVVDVDDVLVLELEVVFVLEVELVLLDVVVFFFVAVLVVLVRLVAELVAAVVELVGVPAAVDDVLLLPHAAASSDSATATAIGAPGFRDLLMFFILTGGSREPIAGRPPRWATILRRLCSQLSTFGSLAVRATLL